MRQISRFLTAWERALSIVLAFAGLSALGDGFIIVHDHPDRWRPPHPGIPYQHPFAPLEVSFHRVDVQIRDQVARTAVDQEFYNPNDRQLEGTYIFPVPKGAHLDKFSMEIGGKEVEAELLPADKARAIYEDIVRRMRDPALLEYAGRDAFKVRIFPIEPRSHKRVKLSYTQLLKADAGLVRYLYPLNTEKFSSKPIPTVSVKIELETKRPLKTVYSPTHRTEVVRKGERNATVGFEAKNVRPDTDFDFYFATDSGEIGANLMAHRPGSDEGCFLLLLAPVFESKGAPAVLKDAMFVLDASGSMAGKKLEQAKNALQYCVESLNPEDRFDIMRFSTETESLFGRLSDASRENRDRAGEFIKGVKSTGGTAIHEALRQALSTRPEKSDRPYMVIFLTDGQPTVGEVDPAKIEALVARNDGKTRVFCFGIGHDVNTHLLDRITEVTRATSQYVLPEEDIEVKVSSFFAKIKEPALTDVRLTFPDGVRVTKLYPATMPELYKGEQLILAGRYSGTANGKLTIEGMVNREAKKYTYEMQFPDRAHENEFVPRLWATRRIGYLLDEVRLRGESAELRDEISELARKYGVVTPYTAYLIHEDEARRSVPMAIQSMPAFESDRAALDAAGTAYRSLAEAQTGQAAVAGARFGYFAKSAEQPATALTMGAGEAKRAMVATAPAAQSPASTAAGKGMAAVADRVEQYSQQVKVVEGRSFYQNGNQWIDAQVQKAGNAKRVRVQFGSQEYFDLAAKEPQASAWLALGQNVQFLFKGVVYEVYE